MWVGGSKASFTSSRVVLFQPPALKIVNFPILEPRVTLLWLRKTSLPPPPTSMTPSDKLGVHPFQWLVCWQIECPCLQPRVTRAGSTCVWLDQQVAGTLSSVILKPIFIHNSSLCAQQSHISHLMENVCGVNHFLDYFLIIEKIVYASICVRDVLYTGIICKKKFCLMPRFIFWASGDPKNCEVISNFSAKIPSLQYTMCVSVCVWVCKFTCLFVYHTTAGPSWSHRSVK